MELRARDVALEAVREALRLGVSEAEAYVTLRKPLTITMSRERVEVARRGEALALGVRVAVGKRVAVGGGSLRSLEDVRFIVESIARIARASEEDPKWGGLPGKIWRSSVREAYDPRVEDINVVDILDSMKAASSRVKELSSNLEVTGISIWSVTVERAIANTSLESLWEKATRVTGYVNVRASEAGFQSSCSEFKMGVRLSEVNFEDLAVKAARRALRGLKAASVKTGRYTVILAPQVTASIIGSLIAPVISAESVQKGRSPLAGKLGEEILGEEVTIEDDPTAEYLYATTSFDDEGIGTRRKTVVRSGVLETFLYDTYTARVEGRESTGNAVRPGVTSAPRPSHLNLIMKPGTESLEEIISEVKSGLVVYETIGEWLSNPVNGYLNATITYAELVENGEFKGVVRGAVISGNIYELLKNKIEGISREVENTYSVYTPAVKLKDTQISQE